MSSSGIAIVPICAALCHISAAVMDPFFSNLSDIVEMGFANTVSFDLVLRAMCIYLNRIG